MVRYTPQYGMEFGMPRSLITTKLFLYCFLRYDAVYFGLADHPVFQDALHVMFSAMSQFRLGKSSTLFHNVARELGHIVLVNKKEHYFIISLYKEALLSEIFIEI